MHWIYNSPSFPKSVFYFDFDRFSNFQFSANKSSISSIKISNENAALQDAYSIKNHCFLPCIRILIVGKFQGKYLNFNFSRFSNSCFTETTGFFISIRVGMESFCFLKNLSEGGFVNCCTCMSVLKFRNFREVHFLFISLSIQTCIPQPLQVRIMNLI